MRNKLFLSRRKSLFVLAFVGYLGCVASSHATSYVKPAGIYASSGATSSSDNPLNDSNVNGVLIRVQWNDLETSAGTYDWSVIDRQVDTAECNANCYSGESHGSCSNNLSSNGRGGSCTAKNWSLSLIGGPDSPSWLYSSPYNVPSFTITVNGNNLTIPKFWNSELLTRLQSIATALGDRYGSDSYLTLVYIPQMSENGVEGHFNGVSNSTLEGDGLTINEWVGAVEQTMQYFGTAFPNNSVAVELHYLMSSSCAGLRVMYDIDNSANGFSGVSNAIAQYGVADWWFDGATNYQADLLLGTSADDPDDLIGTSNPSGDPSDEYGYECQGESYLSGGFQSFLDAGGSVYAQAINQSSVTSAFPNGYAYIFTQAEDLGGTGYTGVNYVEVWQQDVGTTWETDFANFNTAVE